ncbi:hypothetical protein QQ045_003343 [Rhodiola kirilowii]
MGVTPHKARGPLDMDVKRQILATSRPRNQHQLLRSLPDPIYLISVPPSILPDLNLRVFVFRSDLGCAREDRFSCESWLSGSSLAFSWPPGLISPLGIGEVAIETETGTNGIFIGGPLYDDVGYNVEAYESN